MDIAILCFLIIDLLLTAVLNVRLFARKSSNDVNDEPKIDEHTEKKREKMLMQFNNLMEYTGEERRNEEN